MAKRTDVGRRLRFLRVRLGLTQETIAARAHTTAKFVSQIENGHVSPTIGMLARIVEMGLRIPLSAFFAEASDTRDDAAQLVALLEGQSASVRRRVLRVVKALVDD